MPPYGEKFFKGEVVLVHYQSQPAFFARIEGLVPDHKKGWWQMTFLVLSVPVQKMTWILDDDQVRGADFTMGGHPVHIERVEAPEEMPAPDPDAPEEQDSGSVVSMFGEEE
jgi:hypothetical protein